MATSAMQSAFTQMEVLSHQASQIGGRQQHAGEPDSGFADALVSSIRRINELKVNADAQAQAFQAGVPGVELNDVMVNMQKASLAFQMGQQVRNRLISAYHDVMNMQV